MILQRLDEAKAPKGWRLKRQDGDSTSYVSDSGMTVEISPSSYGWRIVIDGDRGWQFSREQREIPSDAGVLVTIESAIHEFFDTIDDEERLQLIMGKGFGASRAAGLLQDIISLTFMDNMKKYPRK